MRNKKIQLVGDESSGELIKKLVELRFMARALVALRKTLRSLPEPLNEDGQEAWLWLRSMEIELGQFLFPLCDALMYDTPLEDVREAIGANRALWDEARSQLGNENSATCLMVLLGEENSGTKEDDHDEYRPLNWCLAMAMSHSMRTSPKVDEAVHNATNEFFGGAFGEWKDRPLTERLVGRVV